MTVVYLIGAGLALLLLIYLILALIHAEDF